ncbi:MAG TPA: hypothetical protein VFF28_03335, partial [Candidatus Nanoarchaeia archaeon]|nr:hypothetical protein [Candidatus Nanoarchaeia archaeon]
TWCYRENESIEVQKCNDAGALLPEGLTCSQKDQVCNGDPDLNIQTCAENLSVSTSALQCHNHKKQCYSELAPYYYSGIMGGNGGCCGDDGLNECWLDSNANACCYYKNASAVAYLTDPDDSMGYCLLLGYNKTKVSAGACDNGDTYCWDEVSQNCCGDEMNETWSYSTSRKIGDVLVNETCYNGRWTLISKKETTYFDLMSKILDMLG